MLQENTVEVKTQILYSIAFISRKSCLLWDNVGNFGTAGLATLDNITRRVRFECWIHLYIHTNIHTFIILTYTYIHARARARTHAHKHIHTHSHYVILIAFPRQKWLRERTSMLRYTHIVCLVLNNLVYLLRRSAAAGLLRLWVRIPPGAWMSVVSVVCCQVEVSATSWGVLPTVVCRCVWSRNLVNDQALAHWGLQRKKKTITFQ